MPLTPVSSYCQLRNIALAPGIGGDDNVIAHDTNLIAFDLPIEADAISPAMIEVTNSSALAIALRDAAGGASPSLNTKKLHVEISFSGTSAGPFDYRFVAEVIERGLTVVARGRCIYAGYVDNAVARLTLNRATLADALYGQAGTISSRSDPRDTRITYTFSNATLPYQKGLFRTEPNPPDGVNDLTGHSYYAMPVVVSPAIAGLIVDADSNANFIDAAAKEFIALSVGLPIAGAPLGSYSHIVADTSDASLNLTGITKGIAVGNLGTSTHLTFARNPSDTDTTKAKIIEPAEGLRLITDLGSTIAKFNPSGGFNNHGLPVGASITDGLCIPNNQNQPDADDIGHELTTNWYDSIFVFTASDASGRGGLYYWPHNGIAYRIGQELEFASCLVYNKVPKEKISTDPQKNKLFVGTAHGVYSVQMTAFWPPAQDTVLTREGGLEGRVVALGLDHYAADFADKTCITAQVQGSGPADGIYRRDPNPATTNDPVAATGYGYDGWYAFDTAGPLIGYHYDAGGNTLYCAYSDQPNVLVRTNNARVTDLVSPTPPATTELAMPNGNHIVGIDGLGGFGACARTEAGAAGLYLVSAGIASMDPQNTLVDRYGATVKVNRVQFAAAGLFIDGNVENALYVASTDAGPYIGGSTWKAMPRQSGIGDQSIQGTAVGYEQTLINRLTTRLYCWTAGGLWISHTAGIWFDDVLQERVDLAPFISALGKLSQGNQSQFLDNDVTVVGFNGPAGKVAAPASSGTSGKAVYLAAAQIAANGLQDIPATGLYLRPLDERNRWVHLFINTASASPTGRIVTADFPSIQSDNATPIATASGKLAQATMRKYHDSAIVPHDAQFDSMLAFQEMSLRTLRPTHRVATDYDTTGDGYTVNLSTTAFYVRKIRFYKGRQDSVIQVQTDVSTVMRAAAPSDQAIGEGLGDSVSKMLRQGRQP